LAPFEQGVPQVPLMQALDEHSSSLTQSEPFGCGRTHRLLAEQRRPLPPGQLPLQQGWFSAPAVRLHWLPLHDSQLSQVSCVRSRQVPLSQKGSTTVVLLEQRRDPLQVLPQQGWPLPPHGTH
jgi:hypothetical protein